jgi:chromosome segregation ATPase
MASSMASTIYSPTSDDAESPQWSAAVGHAGTGKSGRIIDKLMGEKDKLTRALNEADLKVQALQSELATHRRGLDALKEENEVLQHASSVDGNLLSRKDRKIEDLKAELMSKTERMQRAEDLVREQQKELDDVQARYIQESQRAVEQVKHSTNSTEVLQSSFRMMKRDLETRIKKWEKDYNELMQWRENDRVTLERHNVVINQMRTTQANYKKAYDDLVAKWKEMEIEVRNTLAVSEQVDEGVRKKSVEMDQVMKEMKWAMKLQEARMSSLERVGSIDVDVGPFKLQEASRADSPGMPKPLIRRKSSSVYSQDDAVSP